MAPFRVAGINFEHFHMGDLLRLVHEHPEAEIVGVCDEQPERMQGVIASFGLTPEQVFTDVDACMQQTKPDIVILCPAAARHGEYVEKVAPYGVHILVEKPMAASLAEADRMIAAVEKTGKTLVINWPLAWYPPHLTAKRLCEEGVIGDVIEVHFYDGNRGPLWHGADKIEFEPTAERKAASWFYSAELGGGSLLDYLGYGTTLGSWYLNGRAPIEVTGVIDAPEGLEVDEHSVTVARYGFGISKFETRWGTFTDPWTHQPQPKCGFVIVGTNGTIASYDYEQTIRVQSRKHPEGVTWPVDPVEAPRQNPIQYLIHCVSTGEAVTGPLSPAISRIGQQIVDTAFQSAKEKRTLPLIG